MIWLLARCPICAPKKIYSHEVKFHVLAQRQARHCAVAAKVGDNAGCADT